METFLGIALFLVVAIVLVPLWRWLQWRGIQAKQRPGAHADAFPKEPRETLQGVATTGGDGGADTHQYHESHGPWRNDSAANCHSDHEATSAGHCSSHNTTSHDGGFGDHH